MGMNMGKKWSSAASFIFLDQHQQLLALMDLV
jgi:hypothetical protein